MNDKSQFVYKKGSGMRRNIIQSIAIVLGDNDFQCTFFPLLESLVVGYEFSPDNFEDKEYIKTVILEGIRFFYMLNQSKSSDYNEEKLNQIVDYLKRIKIYFDEDAINDYMEVDHDNGAWFVHLESGFVDGY